MSDLDLLYGKCRRNDRGEPCLCLKADEGWTVAAALCPHWLPVSALVGRPISSYADLVGAMREIKEGNDVHQRRD
jgi:hypothetical protein